MPLLIALSGYHNSGKTTLGTFVVSELVRRGYRVAVIKATKEEGDLTDTEGSDTWRYRKSGAELVALLQPDLLTLYISRFPKEKENFLAYLQEIFRDYDLVIMEGFKGWQDLPKVWILSEGEEPSEIMQQFALVELVLRPDEKERALNFFEKKLAEISKLNI